MGERREVSTRPKLPNTRPRTVFGRRDFLIRETAFRVEMREGGIWCWKKGARTKRKITFADLAEVATGQRLLL